MVGEINRVIGDKRAAEGVVLAAYMGVENLAIALTKESVDYGTSQELTRREILRSLGDIIETSIQKHAPMLEPEDVVFMVENLTARLMPIFENMSGKQVGSEEVQSQIDRLTSSNPPNTAGGGTGNRRSSWSGMP